MKKTFEANCGRIDLSGHIISITLSPPEITMKAHKLPL